MEPQNQPYQIPTLRITFCPWCVSIHLSTFDLLLENERNSTQDHEHLSKCIFMLQLKMASVNFEGSEMWNAPDKKKAT